MFVLHSYIPFLIYRSHLSFLLFDIRNALIKHKRAYNRLILLSKYFKNFIVVLFIMLYFLARAFLVVESFISLRKVPLGVYSAVQWAQAIPHV